MQDRPGSKHAPSRQVSVTDRDHARGQRPYLRRGTRHRLRNTTAVPATAILIRATADVTASRDLTPELLAGETNGPQQPISAAS